MSNSELAGGPSAATIGGQVFLIDHYNTSLVFAVYEWAAEQARKQFNPIRELVEAVKAVDGDIPPDFLKAAFLEASKMKLAGEVPGELVTRILRSTEGVAFQLWALTRTHHAEKTLAELQALVTEANRVDVYVEIDRASGANIVVKAVAGAGFFQPASPDESIGSSATAKPD